MDTPRQFSLVRFVEDDVNYPFKKDGVYVFFGEIANMPGHCVVADHGTGRIYSGYHTDNSWSYLKTRPRLRDGQTASSLGNRTSNDGQRGLNMDVYVVQHVDNRADALPHIRRPS